MKRSAVSISRWDICWLRAVTSWRIERRRRADRHLYRITLGSAQGIEPGDYVEIRREQRAMDPSGVETRTERVLALGRVSDQVKAQMSWIAADPNQGDGRDSEGRRGSTGGERRFVGKSFRAQLWFDPGAALVGRSFRDASLASARF